MFKIEAFVEDKRLAEALRALAGLIRGQPSVVPVVNVEHHPKSGKLKAKTNGALLDMFAQHITDLKELRPADIKKFLKDSGRSPGSSAYLVGMARKAKLIKATGKSSAIIYHVLPKKEG